VTEPTQEPAALIDAGWSALAAGDVEHAESACDAALARLPGSIPGLCLKAAIEVSRGRLDAAMKVCRKAMQLEPGDPRPYIQAAEIEIYSQNEDRAIPLALEAIDRATDEPDFIDAMLIKSAAEIGCGNYEDAERTLRELESCSVEEPPLLHRLGQLWLELEEPERAARAFRECVARDPDAVDAHYGLGRAYAELDQGQDALVAWRRVHALDNEAGPPPLSLSKEDLRSQTGELLDKLPAGVRPRVQAAAIVIDTSPNTELVEAGVDPRSVVRIEGGPKRVDTVIVYHHSLERRASSPERIEDELVLELVFELEENLELNASERADLGLL
jgi:tetratricopeptide (TPR) repeat protein